MTDTVALFRVFIRVVEAGSFSRVAAEQNSSQPTVSRQIATLEDHLGTRLFARTTRKLTLTDDGRGFYDRARLALEAVAEAEGAVGRRRARPSGTLQLALPVVFGRLRVIPHLKGFLARYPDVKLDLVMSDGYSDLVEDGLDLAIRSGAVTDPNLIARKIGLTRRVLVAAPSYLHGRTPPAHPNDLAGHDCLAYTRFTAGTIWRFEGPEGPIEIEASGPVQSQSSEGLREAVLSGLGIGFLPVWHLTDEIRSGRAVVLLPEYEPKPVPISAVYPSRRYVPQKTRVMIDYLQNQFAMDPALSLQQP
jgi:DNA-binding transcriptional LysR family regulator